MAESLDDGRYQNVDQSKVPGSHGTSDEIIDPWCDPCYDDCDRKIEAISFCPNCNSFFCKTCDNAHTKLPSSRIHRAMRGSRMPKTQALKPINYAECSTHAGNIKDQFCFSHGEMQCSVCVSSSHKECIVKKISALCNELSPVDIDSLTNDVKSIKEMINTTKSSIDKNGKDINNKRQAMIKEVSELRSKVVAKIDKICSELKTRITQMCQQQSADQADKVSTFAQTIDAFDHILADIEKTSKYHFDEHLFLRMQDIVEKSRQCTREFEESCQQTQTIDMSFSPDVNIVTFLSTLNTIGDIKEDRVQIEFKGPLPVIAFPSHHRHMTEIKATKVISPNVRMTSEKRKCHIPGMAVTPSGFVLLADYENEKVKLISPDHKLLSSILLPSYPFDVSVINSKTAAVVIGGNTLNVLDISDYSSISIIRSIDLGFSARASTPYTDRLIVIVNSNPRSVKMIDLFGKKLWSVSSDQRGQPLFKDPWSLVCNVMKGTSVVLVSDIDKNTLTILDIDNGNLMMAIDVPGTRPLGLTVDRFGNVYVCYNSTNEICIWSVDMDQKRVLLSSTDLRSNVLRAIYNKQTDELIVSYVETDIVDVFKISHLELLN